MKKIALASIAALAALTSQQAFAQTQFEGLSVAAGASLVGANTKLSLSASSGSESAGGSVDFGKNSTVAVLDLSYGFRLNEKMVVGVGGTLDLGNTQSGALSVTGGGMPVSGDLVSLVGKQHHSVYLQPTWLLTPETGVFVKVGYNKMKRSQDGIAGAMLAQEGISTAMNLSGTGFGAGVKTYISKNLFVQAEANAVNYKTKDLSGLASALGSTLSPGESANLSAKVNTSSAVLSIGMTF